MPARVPPFFPRDALTIVSKDNAVVLKHMLDYKDVCGTDMRDPLIRLRLQDDPESNV